MGRADQDAPGAADRARWVALAFVPSSLLLGVTAHISTDIAAFPLLWIVPLALYLLTFVWAFARRFPVPPLLVLKVEALLVLPLVLTLRGTWPLVVGIPLHLGAFFFIALSCHGRLAASRPPAGWLTEFYLWIAFGGMLGGLFNALLAPVLFDSVLEYPLVVLLACLLRPRRPGASVRGALGVAGALLLVGLLFAGAVSLTGFPDEASRIGLVLWLALAVYALRRHPALFAGGVALLTVVSAVQLRPPFQSQARERSFYGVYEVVEDRSAGLRILFHGTTVHGAQATSPELATEPLAYYSRRGPAGSLFHRDQLGTNARVGIVGLGTGSLACYAREGQSWTFFEIDPLVLELARNGGYFSYLSDCTPRARFVIGDARRSLSEAPAYEFDLLVLDAFSSDAIPAHLLTREAMKLYLRTIAEDGALALHVSNRYMQLEPVVKAVLDGLGVHAVAREHDPSTGGEGSAVSGWRPFGYAAHWIAVFRSRERVAELQALDPRWRPLRGDPDARPWTDDYSNILAAIDWSPPVFR